MLSHVQILPPPLPESRFAKVDLEVILLHVTYMGGWRVAYSLEQLGVEVHAISPQTAVEYIGDEAHQAEASDHNPNAAGVVCAADIMQGFGLDLAAVAEQVRQRRNLDLKYVIYNRRIASAASNPSWSWRTYTGSNPHTDHVHVSVGVGPDGQSVQPYDDRTPWGISGGNMPLSDSDVLLQHYAVEAMAGYRDTYIGGPLKGQSVPLVAHLKGLEVAVARLEAAVARLEAAVAELPTSGTPGSGNFTITPTTGNFTITIPATVS